MEELKKLILEYFKNNNKCFTENEIKKNLKIKGEKQTDVFNEALNALVENGSLFFDKNVYRLFTPQLGFAHGEIEINKSGNGFIHTEYGTIFIERKDLNGALNGDKVIIFNIEPGRRQDFKGMVYKILKRRSGKLVFKVQGNGFDASLIPYNELETVDIIVNKNKLKNLRDGDFIVVDVSTQKRDNKFYAEIDKIIGTENTKDIDVRILFEEYNIPVDFSNEIEEEVKKIPTKVNENDLIERIDLRDKDVITIDCDNTKDRDDAVYLEKLDNGNYKLFVNISHVSYYIKKGSKLYEEALRRCNSHYVNNTCNPMFPKIISNGICSLNENVDRLTRTCEMEIDTNGYVVNYKIYNSVINSKKEMKYSEVNKVLEGNKINGYDKFTLQLKLMEELNDILEKARQDRNYIDFNISDIDILEDENGNINDFRKSDTGKAQHIIENFMVITNETIAKHFYWLPFIFRIHEAPDEKVIRDAIDKLKQAGYDIPKIRKIDENTLKTILEKLNEIDTLDIAKSEILKHMKRARYSIENLGHFALQLNSYCHFTSPIRRVSDFIIHSIIDQIEIFDYSKENIQKMEKEIQIICENASKLEKISQEIEEKGRLTLMAQYMEKHINETFEAYITQVYQHGMFAKTKNMIPGKIKLEDIADDKFYFDYDKNAIIGKKTKKKFQIGQKIYVIVKDANKSNRTINFKIETTKIKKLQK